MHTIIRPNDQCVCAESQKLEPMNMLVFASPYLLWNAKTIQYCNQQTSGLIQRTLAMPSRESMQWRPRWNSLSATAPKDPETHELFGSFQQNICLSNEQFAWYFSVRFTHVLFLLVVLQFGNFIFAGCQLFFVVYKISNNKPDEEIANHQQLAWTDQPKNCSEPCVSLWKHHTLKHRLLLSAVVFVLVSDFLEQRHGEQPVFVVFKDEPAKQVKVLTKAKPPTRLFEPERLILSNKFNNEHRVVPCGTWDNHVTDAFVSSVPVSVAWPEHKRKIGKTVKKTFERVIPSCPIHVKTSMAKNTPGYFFMFVLSVRNTLTNRLGRSMWTTLTLGQPQARWSGTLSPTQNAPFWRCHPSFVQEGYHWNTHHNFWRNTFDFSEQRAFPPINTFAAQNIHHLRCSPFERLQVPFQIVVGAGFALQVSVDLRDLLQRAKHHFQFHRIFFTWNRSG